MRDTRDWPMDDEMVRQWEDLSNKEEKLTLKRSEGGKLQAEQVRVHQNLW